MRFHLRNRFIKAFALVALLALTAPKSAFAGFFGDHPSYLHAIPNLRHAVQLLERPDAPNVAGPEEAAVRELDASIADIRQAARDDWKPLAILPALNIHLDWRGRLHEALKEIEKARREISKEEDDRAARGLRNRALDHLDHAMNLVQQAIENKSIDRRF